MSRTTYGSLILHIPKDWEDASIITLLPPTPKPFSLLSTKGVGEQQPNLVIRRQGFSGDAPDLEAFASAQDQMMTQLTDDLKVLSRGDLKLDKSGTPAVSREYSFRSEPQYVQQLQVYFVFGRALFTACGTGAADASFAKLREHFYNVLNTIEFNESSE